MSSPAVAAVRTTSAFRPLQLWFCAGNLATWKKVTSNDISCFHSPFSPALSNGITGGIDLFHRVYVEGKTNSNIYFRDSFKTSCDCWQLSQCTRSVSLCPGIYFKVLTFFQWDNCGLHASSYAREKTGIASSLPSWLMVRIHYQS